MVSELNSHTSASPAQADLSQFSSTTGSRFMHPMKLELTGKLDHNNFLLWRQQVLAAIKGLYSCPVSVVASECLIAFQRHWSTRWSFELHFYLMGSIAP
ncbi:hypothetical protein LWI28_001808 [Acer negundo]|uniref:Retrotransposon Copia-like N-terminal domain-containing protein n=1 Tax=Acer negundo TaxID=4023 RepID=A0AAD5J2Q6_ACENE|nr:hypothetical protein LWI28_001808 [Acer negundo]